MLKYYKEKLSTGYHYYAYEYDTDIVHEEFEISSAYAYNGGVSIGYYEEVNERTYGEPRSFVTEVIHNPETVSITKNEFEIGKNLVLGAIQVFKEFKEKIL